MIRWIQKNRLVILSCIVYFASYVTRNSYAASLAEIINDLGITKQVASIAVTGSFITYGVGQIISGVLGDKLPPRAVISFGLFGTSAINIVMVFLPGITGMNIVWIFNGIFQAMLWPPLVRILSDNMNAAQYSRALVAVSTASSTANILIYLIVPLAISISGWRLSFIISGILGFGALLLWAGGTKNVQTTRREELITMAPKATLSLRDATVKSGLVFIMIAIILQGFLRDGIATWMPSYIDDVFNLGASISILTSVILPVFSIITINVTTAVEHKIGNVIKMSAILFGIALVSTVIISISYSRMFTVEILMMTLTNTAAHGINLMLVCRVPHFFGMTGKISTVSGIINACTYIGSAISTYGFAALSQSIGWRYTIVIWAGICVLGLTLCLVTLKRWNSFCNQYSRY